MSNPIMNQVGALFIPVSDIEKARDWYCHLLGLPSDGEILFGHLYILPMVGMGIVLDSKIFSTEATFKVPAFHFNTLNIHEAFTFMQDNGVELLTAVEFDKWFNFKDPDGNVLMICEC